MSVSDWVPIASVAASAVVGLGVPIVTARFDRQKIRDQADEGRRDELRAVIDDAGAALTAAKFALERAIEEGAREAPLDDMEVPLDRPRKRLHQYDARLDALWIYENRLAVRVRPDDLIYFHYGDAVTELQKAAAVLSDVADGTAAFTDVRSMALRAFRDANQSQIRFHQAAAERVGIAAPQERRRRLLGRATEHG